MIRITTLKIELVAENLRVLKSLLSQPGLMLRKAKNGDGLMIVKMGEGSFEIILYTATHDKNTLLSAVADALNNPNTKWRVMMAGRTETKVATLVKEDETTMEDLQTAIAALKTS